MQMVAAWVSLVISLGAGPRTRPRISASGRKVDAYSAGERTVEAQTRPCSAVNQQERIQRSERRPDFVNTQGSIEARGEINQRQMLRELKICRWHGPGYEPRARTPSQHRPPGPPLEGLEGDGAS